MTKQSHAITDLIELGFPKAAACRIALTVTEPIMLVAVAIQRVNRHKEDLAVLSYDLVELLSGRSITRISSQGHSKCLD